MLGKQKRADRGDRLWEGAEERATNKEDSGWRRMRGLEMRGWMNGRRGRQIGSEGGGSVWTASVNRGFVIHVHTKPHRSDKSISSNKTRIHLEATVRTAGDGPFLLFERHV